MEDCVRENSGDNTSDRIRLAVLNQKLERIAESDREKETTSNIAGKSDGKNVAENILWNRKINK